MTDDFVSHAVPDNVRTWNNWVRQSHMHGIGFDDTYIVPAELHHEGVS